MNDVGCAQVMSHRSDEIEFHDPDVDMHTAFDQDDITDRPMSALAPEMSRPARLAKVRAARNPLLEAAQPLLQAIADMPASLVIEEVELLHRLLAREVSTFQALCNSAQIREEHVVGASYALCTAIDEAAHSTRWGGVVGSRDGGAGIWAGRQLAVAFHDDARGGDKVFLLIGRLVAGPDEHIDLIEVLYFVLGLGFEGRYATAANGRRQLETIRHRLFDLLNAARPEVDVALSPRIQVAESGRFEHLRFVPIWLTVLVVAVVLVVMFGIYKYKLSQRQQDVVRRIEAIGALQPPVLPVPPVRALRLKELLAPEIARGTVGVQEDDEKSAVTFRGDEMFVPGQAALDARMRPLLAKVASEIGQVTGEVRVVGHSDNRPIRTSAIPDNQALSEQRAASVAAFLEAEGVEPVRLKVVGKADTEPVASNATAAGRARNRRVEIVVISGSIERVPGNAAATKHVLHR